MTLQTQKASPLSKDYTSKDFPFSPLVLFYEMTQACDLACQHCRACAQPLANPNELKLEQSMQLIDQISEFPKPPLLVLTGGDPLKRSDIYTLIEYATKKNISVAVTPSATPLVTEQAIAKLKAAGTSRLAISLDGANKETHDGLRRVNGSFQKTLDILTMAREQGLATQVNTTVTKDNLDEIDCIADLIADFSPVLWSVFFLVPVGRGTELKRLSAEECELVFEKLWLQNQKQAYAIKTTEAPHYRRFVLQKMAGAKSETRSSRAKFSSPSSNFLQNRIRSVGVNDGRGAMFVSHVGEYFPSGFMPTHCGQFPQNHIVTSYQSSPMMKLLRDSNQLKGKCRKCEYRKICGGSRARSFALTGDPMESEIDCVYQPQEA